MMLFVEGISGNVGALLLDEVFVLVLVALPSTCPFEVNAGLCFAGPLAALAAADRTAARRAGGLAPCIVCETEPFLKTRKVGMLQIEHS